MADATARLVGIELERRAEEGLAALSIIFREPRRDARWGDGLTIRGGKPVPVNGDAQDGRRSMEQDRGSYESCPDTPWALFDVIPQILASPRSGEYDGARVRRPRGDHYAPS